MRTVIFVLAVFVLAPALAFADPLEEAVRRCSITDNAASLAGPIALLVHRDSIGRIEHLSVQTPRHAGTDVGRCVQRSLEGTVWSEERGNSLLTVAFHPWASQPRRRWNDVYAHIERRGLLPMLRACGKNLWSLRVVILRDGSAVPWGGSAEARTCLEAVTRRLVFPRSGNDFTIWIGSTSLRGVVSRPEPCSELGFPCSDAGREALKDQYMTQFEKRADCADPSAALSWVRQQPGVRYAYARECELYLGLDRAARHDSSIVIIAGDR